MKAALPNSLYNVSSNAIEEADYKDGRASPYEYLVNIWPGSYICSWYATTMNATQ